MSQPPRIGAIAVTTRDNQVLLVQRRNPPDAGLWGFPGGHVEWGESVGAAAARELLEETGVCATPGNSLTPLEIITRDQAGAVDFHFLLVPVSCTYVSGTPHPDDDAMGAAWIDIEDVLAGALPLSRDVDTVLIAHLDSKKI